MYNVFQSLHLLHLRNIDLFQNQLGNSVSHFDLKILVAMVERNYTNFDSIIIIDHPFPNNNEFLEGKSWSKSYSGVDLLETKWPVQSALVPCLFLEMYSFVKRTNCT